jgi:hypothetical protein
VLPQREHPILSKKSKTVLLEYYVAEHQTGWLRSKPGWCKHGKYTSVGQAIRVIEEIQASQALKITYYSAPPIGCKWRIVESSARD